MKLNRFTEDFLRVAWKLHPLTEVEVESVTYDPAIQSIVFEAAGDEELRQQIEEQDEEIAQYQKEEKTLQDAATAAERERDDAWALIDEVKDAETGTTLRQYRDRAEQSRQDMLKWKDLALAAERETMALRKRKGISTQLLRHEHNVITLLGYVAQSEGRYREDARKILGKISLEAL